MYFSKGLYRFLRQKDCPDQREGLSFCPSLSSAKGTETAHLCTNETDIKHTGFLYKINHGSYEDGIGKICSKLANKAIKYHSKTQR